MKNSIQIVQKGKTVIDIPIVFKTTGESFIKAEEILSSGGTNVFLQITHEKTNTFMDLTRAIPYVILYFDGENQFISATFNLENRKGSFAVQIQSKKILFLRYPATFKIEKTEFIQFNSEK